MRFTNFKPLRFTACAVALSATVVGLAGSSASAVVTETDDVIIRANGFDIGGSGGLTNGVPDNPAEFEWDQAWFGVIPTLSGEIHFDGVAGDCARVRLTSFHSDGTTTNDFSAEECAFGNGHVTRAFEVQGQPGVGSVEVTLQTEAGGSWGNLGSKTMDYGPVIDTDSISISRQEFDVGSGNFVGGTAASSATVTWTVAGGTLITPTLVGSLYANNADDLCVRVKVKYSNVNFGVIEERFTPTNCLTDDDLHIFPIGTGQYSNSSIDEVKFVIESTPAGANNWTTVGSVIANLN